MGIVNENDQHLKSVALSQFTFKGDKLRSVGVAIAKEFDHTATLGYDIKVWSDEVPLPVLDNADKNCIGTAWKNLTRWNIITRLEGSDDHRRSKSKSRRGGVAWRYKLVSDKLLAAFLRANHVEPEPPKHQQLPLMALVILLMTAALPSAVVAGPVAETNHDSRVAVTQPAAQPASDDLRWRALAMIESGECDTASGRAGEIGRWQMLKRVWRENTSLPYSSATNPFTALAVAKQEQAKRLHGRIVGDREWFLTWHCPAHVKNPNVSERDYATRGCNMLKKLEMKP